MKIMIVDDHKGMREILRSLLTSAGTQLSECSDGSQALDVYRQFQPDWVLMDNVMKETDGLAATRQILKAFPAARVLMVSEEDTAQIRRAARAAGAKRFVTKDRLLESLGERKAAWLTELESQK